MNTRFPVVLLALSAVSAFAAELPPPPDTGKWVCKFCPEPEEGYSGEVEVGLGYLSDDAFKFGEHTGVTDPGAYLLGNAAVRYRGEDAYYADLAVRDLGFDARSVRLENGRQGRYRLFLTYDEIPHFLSDSGQTPFRGDERLTLPPGWVAAGTTGGMTGLPGALREVELETSRKRVGVGAVLPARRWEYAASVRHETQEGQLRTAGTFFLNAAELVAPIDYTTDEVDLSASYTAPTLSARLAYHASLFQNGAASLTWANPYTPLVAGADTGQLAGAPDNQFHQLRASFAYQFTKATRAVAEVALGRLTQDEDFVRPTLNPSLVVPALPRRSLDGRVDTLLAHGRVTSQVSERLGVSASYRYEDRDNETPVDTYPWVTTDVFVNPVARTNRPYSFTRGTAKVAADYRFAPRAKGSAGVDYDRVERTLQERSDTEETTLWAKLVTRARAGVDLLFHVAHARRDGSREELLDPTVPPQNPLLRKYHLADRERDLVGLRATALAGERVTVGAGIEAAHDDYTDSAIGLTDSREATVSADVAGRLTEATSVHAFLTRQRIDARQAGSSGFSTPDWTAASEDTVDTLGAGVTHALAEGLELGADYAVSLARSEITVADAPFPDRRATVRSLKVHGTYRFQEPWSVHAAWRYERYESEDWALAGVTPTAIPNVLTLGETSPRYDVHFVTVAVRYRF